MFEKRYTKRKELSIILNNKIKEMRKSLDRVNKGCYPKKEDSKGWELYGKLQALSWVKIMYVDGKCFTKWLNELEATAPNYGFKKPSTSITK